MKTISCIYPNEELLALCESSLSKYFEEGASNNLKSFGLTAMIHLSKVRSKFLKKWENLLIAYLSPNDITLALKTIPLLLELVNE